MRGWVRWGEEGAVAGVGGGLGGEVEDGIMFSCADVQISARACMRACPRAHTKHYICIDTHTCALTHAC